MTLICNIKKHSMDSVSIILMTNAERLCYFFAAVADLTVLLLGNLSPAGLHKIISEGTNKKSNPEFTGVVQRRGTGIKSPQCAHAVQLSHARAYKLCGIVKCVSKLSWSGCSGPGILCWSHWLSNYVSRWGELQTSWLPLRFIRPAHVLLVCRTDLNLRALLTNDMPCGMMKHLYHPGQFLVWFGE